MPETFTDQDTIRTEQIATLYRTAPLGVFGALLSGAILVGTLVQIDGEIKLERRGSGC